MLEWLKGGKAKFTVETAAISECGPVRKENQDSWFIDPAGRVYVVSDGMGGGQGGAIASKMMCERLAVAADGARDFPDLLRRSSDAIQNANLKIRQYAAARGWRQMGCTLAAIFMEQATGCAIIAHVGDSRVYRVRNDTLELLTHDHTVAAEIERQKHPNASTDELARRSSPLAHLLTRAVGVHETIAADWRKIDILAGDTYLICSDGVHDMVEPRRIRDCLACTPDAREALANLAIAVINGGAMDNYTAVILKIKEAK